VNSYPKAIVTTGNNKGRKCSVEVLNRLLPHDDTATVKEEVRNVISIYSKLDPLVIYGLIRSAPPSSAFKIFPFIDVAPADSRTATSKGIELLTMKKVSSFYVECHQRGGQIKCRELEISIGIAMKGKAKVDYSSPQSVLFMNVFRDFIGLSLFKKGQEKLSANTLKLNI